jgi:hypothetical protein
MARSTCLMISAGLLLALATPAAAACNVALSPADIDRAAAIAIGAEYGDARSTVARWHGEITVGVAGEPTPDDRDALEQVIAELAVLIAPTRIRLVDRSPKMLVQFAPVDAFARLNPNYVQGNYGFFWMHWNGAGITDADVLISTTGLTRDETTHLIREEVTQSLGLANDTNDDAASIFYAPWTDTQAYTESDTRIIRALYCADVVHGMPVGEFRRVLSSQAAALTRPQIEALQRGLMARGHAIARADGVVGDDTAAAIVAEQQALGLYADGVPSLGLMARLKVKS